jgi:hypothetical protein
MNRGSTVDIECFLCMGLKGNDEFPLKQRVRKFSRCEHVF